MEPLPPDNFIWPCGLFFFFFALSEEKGIAHLLSYTSAAYFSDEYLLLKTHWPKIAVSPLLNAQGQENMEELIAIQITIIPFSFREQV